MKQFYAMLVALLLSVVSVTAQNGPITGTVLDETGLPLPGVNVVVQGTTYGTSTDFDGLFSVQADKGQILEFTFLGYAVQTVKVGDQSKLTINMQPDLAQLDEIVVTAMGFAKEKKALGYASTSVSGEDLANSKAVNPMNALQGKVAGVQITSAADPGSSQNVMIRGASSFGNNQPLYIVDGVPLINNQVSSGSSLNSYADFGTGINAINPDDIQSMDILKGAAATAIYGSRAANGVILITTKSGANSDGKMNIAYDGTIGVSRVGRIPGRQDEFGQGWSGHHALDENGNWGPRYDGRLRPWGNVVDNSQQVAPFMFLEDRYSDYFDLGLNYKNAVSASGGNANTDYFLSFSHNKVDGVHPGENDIYKRLTVSARGSHKANRVKLSSSINFSSENTRAVPQGQGTSAYRSLFEVAENISLVDLRDYNNKFNNLDNYFTPYGQNPYFALNENGATQKKYKFYGKAQLDYSILDNMDFTYRFGGDVESSTADAWMAKVAFTPGAPNAGSSTNNAGSYSQNKRTRYEINHDALLTYNTDLSDMVNIGVLAGTNVNEQYYERVGGGISALDVDGFYNLQNGLSVPVASQYQSMKRMIGVFGSIDLSYSNYLFFNVTARNDWSSTLPKDNNSFFYPGITASFVVSDWMDKQGVDTGAISFAKLRAAYGWTGSDAPLYGVLPAYQAGSVYMPGYPGVDALTMPLGGVNAYEISNTLGSAELRPELTKEMEFGADVRFFDNRVGIDAAYYDKTTFGLIDYRPLDPSTGYTSQLANIADVQNRGVELVFNVTPVKTADWNWDITYNFTKNWSKVVNSPVGEVFLAGFGGAGIYAVEGEEMGIFKTTVAKQVRLDENMNVVEEGGKLYTVVDGNGNVEGSAQEEFTGKSINEDFAMGLSSKLSYKNLSLSATLDYHHGGHMYSSTKDYMHWTGSAIESTYNDRNPLIVPGSVQKTADGYVENTTPVTANEWHTFYNDHGAFEAANYAIIDRSFLKLREVVMGYTLPAEVMQNYKIQSARISFVAGNILLWTPADNPYIDPETTTFGTDVGGRFGEFMSNPTRQSYTLGLSLSF